MALLVFGALGLNEAVETPPATEKTQRMWRPRSGGSLTACFVFGPPWLTVLLVTFLDSWFAPIPKKGLMDADRTEHVATGEDARGKILQLALGVGRMNELGGGLRPPPIGDSLITYVARNYWLYDSGYSNRSIAYWYWVLECRNQEDALKLLAYLGNLRERDLRRWKPSQYAVVMEGPAFYEKKLSRGNTLGDNPWDLARIQDGLVYEKVDGNCRRICYFAVDMDRYRVYHYYATQPFPPDPYQPGAAESR
jgi:hypothetical protein